MDKGAQARQGNQVVIQQEGSDLTSPKGKQEMTGAYQKAYFNNQSLNNLLSTVATRTGARAINGMKNPNTTIKKVVEKRVDDPSQPYGLNDVGDISRGRLVFQNQQALKKGLDTLKSEAKDAGIKVVKEQNMFTNPDKEAKETGYKGYHVDLEMPNGQHTEVQLHTINSYASAMLTHAIHESYGDNVPKNAASESRTAADHVMRMDPFQAQQLADQLDHAAAPAVAEAQRKAIQVAMGQRNVQHAEPLRSTSALNPMGQSLSVEGSNYGL